MKSKKVGDGDHEINTIEPKADRVKADCVEDRV